MNKQIIQRFQMKMINITPTIWISVEHVYYRQIKQPHRTSIWLSIFSLKTLFPLPLVGISQGLLLSPTRLRFDCVLPIVLAAFITYVMETLVHKRICGWFFQVPSAQDHTKSIHGVKSPVLPRQQNGWNFCKEKLYVIIYYFPFYGT